MLTETYPQPARTRRRIITGLLLALVLLAAGGAAYFSLPGLRQTTVTQPQTQTGTVTKGPIASIVTMSGSTAPSTKASLSFGASGRLAELYVKVGDEVAAGQALAKLNTRDLELTIRQQKANLASAQAKLAQTAAGPTATEIASAGAAVVSAEATLVKANNDLANLMRPKSQDELAQAAATLEKARAALQDAQTAYDRVAWRNDAGSSTAAVDLQKATADYQAALAAYNLLLAPPKETDVASAQATVRNATEALESSRVKLNETKSGATAADVAVARATVEQAAAQLAAADLNLENATLVAPFGGRVSAVNFQAGETVSGALLTIVDTRSIRIEGVVDEQDAPKIKVGQGASVRFNSLPGVNYRGTVQSIAPTAVVQTGVSTYAVIVALDTKGEELLGGLTGSVQITTQQKPDALLVPTWAVLSSGGQRVVNVRKADGAQETRQVQVGITNSTQTEIISGVAEGETVVAPVTTTRTTTTTAAQGGGGFPVGGR